MVDTPSFTEDFTVDLLADLVKSISEKIVEDPIPQEALGVWLAPVLRAALGTAIGATAAEAIIAAASLFFRRFARVDSAIQTRLRELDERIINLEKDVQVLRITPFVTGCRLFHESLMLATGSSADLKIVQTKIQMAATTFEQARTIFVHSRPQRELLICVHLYMAACSLITQGKGKWASLELVGASVLAKDELIERTAALDAAIEVRRSEEAQAGALSALNEKIMQAQKAVAEQIRFKYRRDPVRPAQRLVHGQAHDFSDASDLDYEYYGYHMHGIDTVTLHRSRQAETEAMYARNHAATLCEFLQQSYSDLGGVMFAGNAAVP